MYSLKKLIVPELQDRTFILASSSPRRKDIMDKLGLTYTVVPSTFPETLDKSLFSHPSEYVKENARQKALEVYERLKAEGKELPDAIIGSDTVVAHGNKILEKPDSVQHAIDMLNSLSGSTHMVYTGVALVAKPRPGDPKDQPRVTVDFEGTEVIMHKYTESLAKAYVATGEPMDKAGSYGYQGVGAVLVKGINGCSWNVIGLPASKLFYMLIEFLH
ncbi:hypothetical protein BGZ73_006070 [Actinomortierella ambigua]|nr:hypothetical protein BGZ73_006070 [Actinomortierella ambigua]